MKKENKNIIIMVLNVVVMISNYVIAMLNKDTVEVALNGITSIFC